MATIDFGGTKETVVTRKEFPMAKARKVLKNEVIAIIGYGVQGPAQSLNLRDNGFNVIIGQAQAFKRDWDRAVKDGWVPGKTLFDIDEAVRRGTIIQMLVSDAAQRAIWPVVKANLKPGAALYFSHGFSIAYQEHTAWCRPKMWMSLWLRQKVRELPCAAIFSRARASIRATPSNRTPPARRKNVASPSASASVGLPVSDNLPARSVQRPDGERGVLMGALAGIMEAQYDVLRQNGHTRAKPSMKPWKSLPKA